jgi:hypothetical protein
VAQQAPEGSSLRRERGEEEGGGRPEDQFAGCIAVTEYSRPVPWQVLHDSTPPAVVLICA